MSKPKPALKPPAGQGGSAEPAALPALPIPESLSWFLILLPGFVLVSVMSIVTQRPAWSDLEFGAYSLIGSIVCLAVTLPVFLFARQIRWVSGSLKARGYSVPALFYVLNFSVAVALGGFLGSALENDASVATLNKVLGLKLKKRSWRNPMNYVIQANYDKNLIVNKADGRADALMQEFAYTRFFLKGDAKRSYEGFPLLMPHGNDTSQVYLSPACRKAGDSYEVIEGPGVMFPISEVDTVELIDLKDSACFAQVQAQGSCSTCSQCLSPPKDMADKKAELCISCRREVVLGFVSKQLASKADPGATLLVESCRTASKCDENASPAVCQASAACLAAVAAMMKLEMCTTPWKPSPR